MKKKICVVIPCYNVKEKILSVINSKYLSKIDKIVVVDDKCPQNTGLFLKKKLKNNNKIKIIFHKNNLGTGLLECFISSVKWKIYFISLLFGHTVKYRIFIIV